MVNQPSGWSYWIHDCDYVSFDKCKIYAEVQYPNNDGIHINSSRNVTISNCDITCGDDCLVVRANNRSLKENKVCEKVTVTNCNLTSYSGGIRIGWICDGVIRNCTFSNIVMTDTSVGISILLPNFDPSLPDHGRENTLIENLIFSNIIMDKIYARPIKIAIGQEDGRCEAIRNVYFNNIRSFGLEFPHLLGKKDCPLETIVFTDCSFEKVSDEMLPNYKQHGAADWDREKECPMITNAENVIFNNTTFPIKEIKL
jgi:polygalacturonase